MSKLAECIQKLVGISDQQGYLTFDNILDVSDTFSLSVSEVDKASEAMQMRGIIVYETEPAVQDKSDDLEDYSRVDYNSIFNEIVSMSSKLKQFVDEVRELPPPQYGEVQSLCMQVDSGNEYAKKRLITIHIRNVLKIALSLSQQYDYNIEDAVSAGLIGLCTAVDKFDPNGFSAFQSYASMWIQQNIQRECKPYWMRFYYPAHYLSGVLNVLQFCKDQEYDTLIENDLPYEDKKRFVLEISNKLDIGIADAEDYLRHIKEQKSIIEINELLNTDEEPRNDSSVEDYVSFIMLKREIESILSTLTEREEQIIKMRFGLENNEPMTLEDVGKYFNVTRERIRQIEAKALRKLQHPSRSKVLKDYVEMYH